MTVRVFPGSAKQTFGEVGTRMVIWWQVVLTRNMS